MVIIPGDQPEEGINGCEGKDFEKRKVHSVTLEGIWKWRDNWEGVGKTRRAAA